MPNFKTLEEAERYGEKNYFEPEIRQSNNGGWIVFDRWDLRNKR